MFSNEVKIGILTVVAIGLTVWGFNFIKGKNLFSSSTIYKVKYSDVSGLSNSAPVLINGLKVGIVSDMYPDADDAKKIIVELDVQNEFDIPKTTTAAITSGGLMSGNVVVLEREGFCKGADCAQSGAFIKGRRVGMVESFIGVDPSEYAGQMKGDVNDLLDSLNMRVADESNDAIAAKTLRDVQKTTENLRQLTGKLDLLLGNSAGKFNSIMNDMQSMTSNLQKSNSKISEILNNSAALTNNLKQIDMNATVGKVNGTLGVVDNTLVEAESALAQIKSSLATADKALNDVNSLVTKLNNGEGTLGYLLTDDKLAKDLEVTLNKVSELSQNLDEKPYNYIPFKKRKKVLKYRKMDEAEGK